jgi:hypothetical protein
MRTFSGYSKHTDRFIRNVVPTRLHGVTFMTTVDNLSSQRLEKPNAHTLIHTPIHTHTHARTHTHIHSFSSLSYDRPKASSKAGFPHSAIQSFLLQMNPLLSLRSSSSFLRLLPRLPVTSIPPFIFPSKTCCRRQFLRKMWPIQFTFRLLISCGIFLCALSLSLSLSLYIYIYIHTHTHTHTHT